MGINIHFDTGSTSREELAALATLLSTVAPVALPAVELRALHYSGYNGLSGSMIEQKAPLHPYTGPYAEAGEAQSEPAAPEQSKALANEEPTARKRGEPAPGRSRRTKAEIAEDEAAEKAEAAAVTAAEPVAQAISTGEERVGPDDSIADQEQDAEDEAAEASNKAPGTIDDLRSAMLAYSTKHGMEATQRRGPGIFVSALGPAPEGEPHWKMSLVPTDKLDAVIKAWVDATASDG